MSTDRRLRRAVKPSGNGGPLDAHAGRLRLAPDVRLSGGRDAPVLVCKDGDVRLNGGAVEILRLCDGSRHQDAIVAAITSRSSSAVLARDIVAFLNVARTRGWIVER